MSAEVIKLEEAPPAAKSKLALGWEPIGLLLSDPDFAAMIEAQKELAYEPEAMPFVVDWATLLNQEKNGLRRTWTARVSGALAGFIPFTFEVHPLHMTTVRAQDGGTYVAPKYRGKGVIYRRLWLSALDELKRGGIKVVFSHDSAQRPQDAFFAGLGFRPMSRVYIKVL